MSTSRRSCMTLPITDEDPANGYLQPLPQPKQPTRADCHPALHFYDRFAATCRPGHRRGLRLCDQGQIEQGGGCRLPDGHEEPIPGTIDGPNPGAKFLRCELQHLG